MFARVFLLLFFLIFPSLGKSEILLGTGFSSVTEGRTIPLLNLGIDSPTYAVLLSSVGVSNDVYYHNAYLVSGYRQVDMDNFWWGKVRVGLGGGLFFSERGFRDEEEEEKSSDFSLGPSVRATWEIIPYGFVGIESYFGLGSFNFLVLSTQQVSHLVFGVRF